MQRERKEINETPRKGQGIAANKMKEKTCSSKHEKQRKAKQRHQTTRKQQLDTNRTYMHTKLNETKQNKKKRT